MLTCSHCQQANPVSSKFCDECGAPIPTADGHSLVSGRTLRIGREADNDVCVAENNPQVSRHHALVTIDGAKMWIEDLGTANGTFINGIRVTGRMQFRLTDDIRLGSYVFNTAELRLGMAGGAAMPERNRHEGPPAAGLVHAAHQQDAGLPVAAVSSSEMANHISRSCGWMKLTGITMILVGVLYACTIVGLIVAWIPIWMGILLTGAASDGESYAMRGDMNALTSYHRRLGTFFTISGVALLLVLLSLIAVFVMIIGSGISLMALAGGVM